MASRALPPEIAPAGGCFDEYIYGFIIEAALDDWTPELHIFKSARTAHLSSRDLQAIRFLSRCCLVNREWLGLAQRLLYRAVSLDNKSSKLRTTLQNPRTLSLVRYLSLKSDRQCAAKGLSDIGDMPDLRNLVVRDAIVGDSLTRPTRMQSSPFLQHLLYEGGDTYQLGELLTVLPNLISLQVGRFSYSPRRCSPPQKAPITCKLRQVTFQSVYHYDASLFDWIFASSKSSIEHLTIANYGSLLNDLISHLGEARRLELTIKRNVFGVPEDPDQYQLSVILPRFPKLEEVYLHVGQDWSMNWPDAKHASLQQEFPSLLFHYVKGRLDFLNYTCPSA